MTKAMKSTLIFIAFFILSLTLSLTGNSNSYTLLMAIISSLGTFISLMGYVFGDK